MVDIALLQSISYLAETLGVCVAATYYILNLVNTSKTRQAQTFLNRYKNYSRAQFIYDHPKINNYSEYANVFENKDTYRAMSYFMSYFKSIGVRVRENLIDIGLGAKFASGETKAYSRARAFSHFHLISHE
jgi:hypothetical protein